MKYLFIFLTLLLSVAALAQDTKIYAYESDELIEKPKPTKAFKKWLKVNNDSLGRKPKFIPKEEFKITFVFFVDEQGKIQDVKIWRGIMYYDNYAHKLFTNNPEPWISGKTKKGAVVTEVFYQFDFNKNKNSIRNEANERID